MEKAFQLEWLNYAVGQQSNFQEMKRGTAESLRTIAQSYGELTKKVNSEYTYAEYWLDLEELVQEDLVSRTGYYLALGIYRYTAGELKSRIPEFCEQGGVERTQIKQLLHRIEQGTAQIEKENRLDEEDQMLVKEIKNQIQGAEDMAAMTYGS